METDWTDKTLEKLGRIITGKTPPSTKSEYFGGEIPFITPTDFDGRRYIDTTDRCLTDLGVNVVQSSRIPRGAVMTSCIGSDMGKVAIAAHDSVTNQQINSIIIETDDEPLFVYYNLSIRKQELQSIAAGSAQPILNKTAFGKLQIQLPSPPVQRAITHILGTLDDKIELNRKMNETFEAMARAIFKAWFIDFEPVRAKMEGRWKQRQTLPGLPAHLYEYFPDCFVTSEIGEVPKGWTPCPLPDAIQVNPQRSLSKDQAAPYLDMASMPTRGHCPDNVVARPFGSGMKFENGDTLVARITPCLENGKTAYVDFLDTGQVGWGSTEYIVLRPKPPLPNEFAYLLARTESFRDFAIQSMTGSSGRQRVPKTALTHFYIPTIPKPIAEQFGRLIGPLFDRASKSVSESRTLAALRDTLLPKLISGELRVKEAEKELRAVL